MTAGPLAGLRVLDASSMVAAPLLCALLADQGADVVALEPPGGHPFRVSPLWLMTARDKRSVVVDDGDRPTLHGLLAAADVVVVNEPEARLARRGLDPATLLAAHPALVIAHVSGYGADGPYADRPGNGTLAEAFAGLTGLTAGPDGAPVLLSTLLGDSVMAWAGAFGVLAACHDVRHNGARGRVVDVNPVDALLHVVGTTFLDVAAGTPSAGEASGATAGEIFRGVFRGVFRAADGRWVAVSVATARQRRALADLVGAVDTEGPAFEEAVRTWVDGSPREEVLARALDARLPMAPVNDATDVASDPHVRARGLLRTVRTTDGAVLTVPAPAPRTAGTPPAGPAVVPALGEHTAEVVAEWRGPPDRSGSR